MRHTITPTSLASAVLLLACAGPKDDGPEAPAAAGAPATSSSARCPAGGPSVSIKVRGRSEGEDLASDELGVLLGWIGGFVQPCREASPEAPQFTLEIHLDQSGKPPTFDLADRAALPGLAACLDDSFAKAPPPPPGSMTVEIVIPWGCPTLGAGFVQSTEPTEPPS